MQRGIGYSEKDLVISCVTAYTTVCKTNYCTAVQSCTPSLFVTLYCYVIPQGDTMMASTDLVYDHRMCGLYLLAVCLLTGNRELFSVK